MPSLNSRLTLTPNRSAAGAGVGAAGARGLAGRGPEEPPAISRMAPRTIATPATTAPATINPVPSPRLQRAPPSASASDPSIGSRSPRANQRGKLAALARCGAAQQRLARDTRCENGRLRGVVEIGATPAQPALQDLAAGAGQQVERLAAEFLAAGGAAMMEHF